MNIKLVSMRIKDVIFKTNLDESGTLKLFQSNEIFTRVKLGGNAFSASLKQTLHDENNEHIDCQITVVAAFETDTEILSESDNKQIHKYCYEAMFPYASAVIQSLTSSAGLPAFDLKKIPISEESIRAIPMPASSRESNRA